MRSTERAQSSFPISPRLLLAVALLAFAVACGSAGSTNNDQGTSFTNLGYFDPDDTTAGDAGALIALGLDRAFLVEDNVGAVIEGQFVTTSMGLENRLLSDVNADGLTDDQNFIRVVRIDCDYEIPGSDPSLNIPGDSVAEGAFIDAGGTEFIEFPILSTDLFAYLNANRNLLPEFPFRMTAQCRAVGVTRAGDTLTTNDAGYFIQVSDQAECCFGEGLLGGGAFQEGEGTGGEPDTFAPPGSTTGSSSSSGGTTSSSAAN